MRCLLPSVAADPDLWNDPELRKVSASFHEDPFSMPPHPSWPQSNIKSGFSNWLSRCLIQWYFCRADLLEGEQCPLHEVGMAWHVCAQISRVREIWLLTSGFGSTANCRISSFLWHYPWLIKTMHKSCPCHPASILDSFNIPYPSLFIRESEVHTEFPSVPPLNQNRCPRKTQPTGKLLCSSEIYWWIVSPGSFLNLH